MTQENTKGREEKDLIRGLEKLLESFTFNLEQLREDSVPDWYKEDKVLLALYIAPTFGSSFYTFLNEDKTKEYRARLALLKARVEINPAAGLTVLPGKLFGISTGKAGYRFYAPNNCNCVRQYYGLMRKLPAGSVLSFQVGYCWEYYGSFALRLLDSGWVRFVTICKRNSVVASIPLENSRPFFQHLETGNAPHFLAGQVPFSQTIPKKRYVYRFPQSFFHRNNA